jgi:prepilin-type N-terminal cleavage/methylation domain-containing protein
MNQQNRHRNSGSRQGFSILELLVVLSLFGILAAIAVPMAKPAVSGYQIAGQAHALAYDVSLAKMQAASRFTQARLFVNLAARTYRTETWDKTTSAWVAQSDAVPLPYGVGFGYGALGTPPPNTQGTMGQAAACLDASNEAILGTSCVQFNSRGIPIDGTGTPTGSDVVYLTDGSTVYAVAVTLAGLTQLWWSPASAAGWQKQ